MRRVRRWAAAAMHMRRHNRALPDSAPVLNFYAHRPAPAAKIYGALRVLGMRAALAARGDQPTIAWDPYTVLTERALARLPPNAINRRCVDVSKTRVAAAWAEVAGYGVAVDPLSWPGPMAGKSERNGMHDGRLLQGPLRRRRAGLVYERFVDTIVDGHARAQRTFVVGGASPLVFDIRRPRDNPFDGVDEVATRSPADVYSTAELVLVLRFAEAIGMEYGEIDVVRDKGSGLIYAIDANRTPLGGVALSTLPVDEVFGTLAMAIAEMLRSWRPLARPGGLVAPLRK